VLTVYTQLKYTGQLVWSYKVILYWLYITANEISEWLSMVGVGRLLISDECFLSHVFLLCQNNMSLLTVLTRVFILWCPWLCSLIYHYQQPEDRGSIFLWCHNPEGHSMSVHVKY
jgi:hypothetical protein